MYLHSLALRSVLKPIRCEQQVKVRWDYFRLPSHFVWKAIFTHFKYKTSTIWPAYSMRKTRRTKTWGSLNIQGKVDISLVLNVSKGSGGNTPSTPWTISGREPVTCKPYLTLDIWQVIHILLQIEKVNRSCDLKKWWNILSVTFFSSFFII